MGKGQLILLLLVGLALLALSIATWGSIGSVMCAFCLIIMVAALLYRKFVLDRDEDMFNYDL